MRKATSIALLLCAGICGGKAAEYQIVTDEHVDLQVILSGGNWDSLIRSDSLDLPRNQGLLYENDAEFTAPSGAQWSFLGVAPGDPIYILPQTQYVDKLFLGFGSDDGSIPFGALASYFETDPRVNNTAAWTKISLEGMRFTPDPTDTATNTAHFSLWANAGAIGGPSSGTTIWMATSDGLNSQDATWLYSGGHSHYNWGFSRRGYYQLDFRFSGFLNDGSMTFVESEVFTFHFGIEYLPTTIPEPTPALLFSVGAGIAIVFRRNRRASSLPRAPVSGD